MKDLKPKWEGALTACSISMLGISIDHYKDELSIIDREVQVILGSGAHLSSAPEFTLKESELNSYLEKLNREIITNKEKKNFIVIGKPSLPKRLIIGIIPTSVPDKDPFTKIILILVNILPM